MSTALTSLNPFVLPYVRSCPNTVALHYIRQSAIEFCRRTLVWRKTLAAVSSSMAALTFTAPLVNALSGTLTAPFAGVTRTDYILTFSDGTYQTVTLNNGSTTVAWVNAVTADVSATYSQVSYTIPATTDASVVKLLKFSVDGVKRAVANPDFGEDITMHRDLPDIAWTTDRVTFSVSPAPAIAGTQYGLIVALMPTQTAATIPDELFDGFAEDIAAGAMARIFALPRTDWGDAKVAIEKRMYFDHRIGIVASQAAKGFSRGRRRVKAHFY
jgi:hypothetical protein